MIEKPDTLLLPLSSYNLLKETLVKKKTKKPAPITLEFESSDAMFSRDPDLGAYTSRGAWKIVDPKAPRSATEIARGINIGDDAKLKKGEAKILASAVIDGRAERQRLEDEIRSLKSSKRGFVVSNVCRIAAGQSGATVAEQLRAVELLMALEKKGWVIS